MMKNLETDYMLRAAIRQDMDSIVSGEVDLWPRLETQLAAKHKKARVRLQTNWAVSLTLLALLALSLFFLWPPAKPATAEEVVHRALVQSTRGVGAGEILYERFMITAPSEPPSRTLSAIAQLWQSEEGHAIRFEVVNQDDELVMFTLRSGDHLWQSLHFRDPIATQVEAILEVPNAEPGVSYPRTPLGLPHPSEGLSPFRKGILYALPDLDQAILHGGSACAGIACLMQALEEIDSGIELRLQNADLDRMPLQIMGRSDSGVELRLQDGARQQNDYQIDLLDAASGITIGNMTIDASTFTLLKYVDRQGVTVRLLERDILDRNMVPADLFSSPPLGVRVLRIPEGWEQAENQSEDLTDHIWVISTEPEPGQLSMDEVSVTLGYQLISRPLSSLRVYLMPYFPFCNEHPDGCALGVVGAAEAMVTAGEGSLTLRMPIDPWDVKGEVVLMAEFTSLRIMMTFEEYLWAFPGNDSR